MKKLLFLPALFLLGACALDTKEAKEAYDDAEQVFPFTEDDADTIRATIDRLLEDEFGVEAMADYEKNCR